MQINLWFLFNGFERSLLPCGGYLGQTITQARFCLRSINLSFRGLSFLFTAIMRSFWWLWTVRTKQKISYVQNTGDHVNPSGFPEETLLSAVFWSLSLQTVCELWWSCRRTGWDSPYAQSALIHSSHLEQKPIFAHILEDFFWYPLWCLRWAYTFLT